MYSIKWATNFSVFGQVAHTKLLWRSVEIGWFAAKNNLEATGSHGNFCSGECKRETPQRKASLACAPFGGTSRHAGYPCVWDKAVCSTVYAIAGLVN